MHLPLKMFITNYRKFKFVYNLFLITLSAFSIWVMYLIPVSVIKLYQNRSRCQQIIYKQFYLETNYSSKIALNLAPVT